MSEYQYYEFRAVDRRLTAGEMGEMRAVSTRGRITPTSYTNEYHFGDFKGDPDRWMEQYFDAHLYYANWGTRILQLRVPARLLDPAVARSYCACESMTVRVHNDAVILTFSVDESDDGWSRFDTELDSFMALRSDLMRGDHTVPLGRRDT